MACSWIKFKKKDVVQVLKAKKHTLENAIYIQQIIYYKHYGKFEFTKIHFKPEIEDESIITLNIFVCNHEAAVCVKSLSKAKSKPANKTKIKIIREVMWWL